MNETVRYWNILKESGAFPFYGWIEEFAAGLSLTGYIILHEEEDGEETSRL